MEEIALASSKKTSCDNIKVGPQNSQKIIKEVSKMDTFSVQGDTRLQRPNSVIFCVSVNRRTSSTPQSTSLKMTELGLLEVVESGRS